MLSFENQIFLFKGMKKNSTEWAEGHLCQTNNRSYIIPCGSALARHAKNGIDTELVIPVSYEVSTDTVCVISNAVDKNSRKISSGDIIEFITGDFIPEVKRGLVVFDGVKFAIRYDFKPDGSYECLNLELVSSCEIIGNYCVDKHLLKTPRIIYWVVIKTDDNNKINAVKTDKISYARNYFNELIRTQVHQYKHPCEITIEKQDVDADNNPLTENEVIQRYWES